MLLIFTIFSILDIWKWSEISAQTYNFENFLSQGLLNILQA